MRFQKPIEEAVRDGVKAIDNNYGHMCIIISQEERCALVVYDDEPDCIVSTANHPGRFIVKN